MRTDLYKLLGKLDLKGNILDVGGSRKAGYHELIKGEHTFEVVNLNKNCNPDHIFNIEADFPLGDALYENALCLNVLEHVFEYEHVYREMRRCVKKGGLIIISTPFMHHIHGSPDDYLRFTESAYHRMSAKHGGTIMEVHLLGTGLFSLLYQTIQEGIPTHFLNRSCKTFFLFLDKLLNKFKRVQKLHSLIPLGYLIIIQND